MGEERIAKRDRENQVVLREKYKYSNSSIRCRLFAAHLAHESAQIIVHPLLG
jgi:hypothetical protein